MPISDNDKRFFDSLKHGPLTGRQIKHFADLDNRSLMQCIQKFTEFLDVKHVAGDPFYGDDSAVYRVIEIPTPLRS